MRTMVMTYAPNSLGRFHLGENDSRSYQRTRQQIFFVGKNVNRKLNFIVQLRRSQKAKLV